jgi:hypothetical protein
MAQALDPETGSAPRVSRPSALTDRPAGLPGVPKWVVKSLLTLPLQANSPLTSGRPSVVPPRPKDPTGSS